MSVTGHAAGSQLTVIGTPHTLATVAIAGVFQLLVDLSPMAAGDIVELRARQKVTGAEANPLGVYVGRFADAQSADEAVAVSQPLTNDLTGASSADFILTQVAGSPRTFTWKALRIA